VHDLELDFCLSEQETLCVLQLLLVKSSAHSVQMFDNMMLQFKQCDKNTNKFEEFVTPEVSLVV